MRRWLAEALPAADLVAGHAGLWLPGALAWSLTLGWIPLVVAVARPPNVGDLTYLGARLYSSGDWPWNAVTTAAGALLLAGIGLVLFALAEAALAARADRRSVMPGRAIRLVGIAFVTAAPVFAALLATATAFVLVALREFNAPLAGDPLLRTIGRVTPFLAAAGIAWVLAGAVHAAASRAALFGDAGMVDALAGVPRALSRLALRAAVHLLAILVLRLAYLAFTAVLLSVLWQPIGMRFAAGGIDAAVLPLLVGFVAIWLCLVLAGGALHAWGSVTWTRLLRAPGAGSAGPGGTRMEARIGREP